LITRIDWLKRLAFPNANSGIAGSSQRVLNHDMLGRLSVIAHWDSEGEHRSHHGYSYNQAGLRSAETLGASSPSTRAFTYDDYRQLSTAVNPGDTRYDFIFSHDATGNRLTAQWHHGAGAWDQWSFTPDALNQFASARFNAAPAAGPQYDANGNLTDRLGDGFVDYVWDEENRLIAINYGSGNYTLIDYDGLSRRVRRVEYRNHAATETIHYVYDGLIPVQELDENFAVVRQLTRGLDLAGTLGGAGGTGDLLAVSLPNGGQADGWESHYYLYDGNGNVTGLVAGEDISSRGIVQDQIVAEYVYSPFGRLLNDPSANLLDQPWQFSSQEAHAASGLHLYLYRAYDAEWGRWLSRDPIGETGGINLYGFVGNSPISFVDLLGSARLGYRPLSDGQAPIVTAPEGSIADSLNFEVNHEHFFFDDGKDLFGSPVSPELANIGYGPVGNISQYPGSGAFSEDPRARNYKYLNDYFDDDLLRKAIINILDAGDWRADQYDVFWDWDKVPKKNCQDFTAAARAEYHRLRQGIELERKMQDAFEALKNGGRSIPTIRQKY